MEMTMTSYLLFLPQHEESTEKVPAKTSRVGKKSYSEN